MERTFPRPPCEVLQANGKNFANTDLGVGKGLTRQLAFSLYQISTLIFRRMNVNLSRDPLAYFSRFIQLPIFVPFILIFLGRLKHNQGSIQDRIGILYNTVSVPPYMGIISNVAFCK